MLNKINEITKLLTYAYTPDNVNVINNILDNTIERCETLYYKTVLYPQLETIWNAESNNTVNYYHLESTNASTPSTPRSTISCSHFNFKTIDKYNKNKSKINSQNNLNNLNNKEQYILKDITVLIYIYVATQPISVFSGNQ
jgi:hypothetical protein